MVYLKKVREVYGYPDGFPEKEEGVLYLCDCPETAKELTKRQMPVLIRLHEKNREMEFPGIRYAVEKPEELDREYFEKIYRRILGLPWDILETKRCLVRETAEGDVDSFYQIYAHPGITKYMEALYPDPELERQYVREYIEKVHAFYEFGVWTVVGKASGEVIGRAGFYYREGFENPELGFVIGVPWQGKGIAGEVCRAVLEYGKEALCFEKVNAMVHPENEASLKLCTELGFVKKEMLRLEGRDYVYMEKAFTSLL